MRKVQAASRRSDAGGYVVRDANRQAIAYLYSRGMKLRRGSRRCSQAEGARQIAENISRLPELLGNVSTTVAGDETERAATSALATTSPAVGLPQPNKIAPGQRCVQQRDRQVKPGYKKEQIADVPHDNRNSQLAQRRFGERRVVGDKITPNAEQCGSLQCEFEPVLPRKLRHCHIPSLTGRILPQRNGCGTEEGATPSMLTCSRLWEGASNPTAGVGGGLGSEAASFLQAAG
jgi:hypothetical protein